MASDDQDLGERDHNEAVDYPPSARTIHTQGYDLSVATLKEQWDDETLILPDFQREYVWDNAKASRLIESLLLNIPVPPLFFAENEQAKYEIVDGHQRVRSIARFLENQFPLSGLRISQEFKGLRFFKLPEREQRFLKTRSIRAIVIAVDSSPTMKFEVFERLNTGGLALNAQEIRHALYAGPLNNLLKELELDTAFRTCLATPRPRKRMVDRELVLRFLALSDHLDTYRPPLVRFLNEYMEKNRKPSEDWLDERRQLFVDTMSTVAEILGGSAFRVIGSTGTPLERNINRALFDAQMLVFAVSDEAQLRANRKKVITRLAGLFSVQSFEDAIRLATGDRTRTLERTRDVASALTKAGVDVDMSSYGDLE